MTTQEISNAIHRWQMETNTVLHSTALMSLINAMCGLAAQQRKPVLRVVDPETEREFREAKVQMAAFQKGSLICVQCPDSEKLSMFIHSFSSEELKSLQAAGFHLLAVPHVAAVGELPDDMLASIGLRRVQG